MGINRKSFLILFGLSLVFFACFVTEAHFVRTSAGGTSFNVNEDVGFVYNITINNTDLGQAANITQVNISLPAGFLYVPGAQNGTNRLGDFTNTSNVLSWSNFTAYLINGSVNNSYFWFNATASTPGNYNITVMTLNATGPNYANLSVTVNDTTAPVVTLISPANGNSTINAGSNLQFTFNVTDSSSTNCSLILNGVAINFNSSVNVSGGNNFFTNSTSYRIQNTWSVNCTDNANNAANSSGFSLSLYSFNFTGNVYDEYGSAANNTNVSVALKNSSFSDVATYSTTSNASGWFSLSIYNNSNHMYSPTLIQRNVSTNAVQKVGQSLPSFPFQEFSQLSNVNFYLRQAGTINVTVRNSSNSITPNFAVQIKDTKLGYPITCSGASGSDYLCYVPKGRNYSLMVYPSSGGGENFVPVSYNWNNFSSTSDYTINSISSYNATTNTLHKQFNVTESFARITGYIQNSSGADFADWKNFTVVPFLLEPGSMVFMTYGTLPFNTSAWNSGQTDVYNETNGWFNITVPYSSAETVNYLLFAAAQNGTFYGGYRNVTVSSANINVNFTMRGLLGSESNITMSDSSGGDSHVVYTKRQSFNLVNSTNSTLTQTSAHIELTVDYSSYGAAEFTFMEEVSSSGSATFSFPLLNVSGFKEMNVYSQTYSPKRVSTRTAAQIATSNNVTLAQFNPEGIGATLTASSLNISAYHSNSTCDVPNPPSACLLASFTEDEAQANMFGIVIGGGAISLRMTYGGVSVHYVNVDLLASGPPEADFENSAGSNEGGTSSFTNAVKFGSEGPTIYDYVLVAVPYTPGSTTQTGLDESSTVNLTIPTFYDEDYTTPIWSSSNGTSAAALAGNYSHYSAYQSDWQILMNTNNTCYSTSTGTSAMNSSVPCNIQTADNKIWIRLPHFSGTEPSVTGSLITATATVSSETTSNGGIGFPTYTPSAEQMTDGYQLQMLKNTNVNFDVGNEKHSFKLIEMTLTSATFTLSSDTITDTLDVGQTKKYDVNNDRVYDVSVFLKGISGSKATFVFTSIQELMPSAPQAATAPSSEQGEESPPQQPPSSSMSPSSYKWILVVVVGLVIVIIVIVVMVMLKKRNKHSSFR